VNKSTANQERDLLGGGMTRKLWKVWKKGGLKEPYLAAKRRAKHEVYTRLKNLLPKQVLVIFMKKKN